MVSQSDIIKAVSDHPGCTLIELSIKIYGHADTASTEFTNLKTKIYRMRGRDFMTEHRPDGAVVWVIK